MTCRRWGPRIDGMPAAVREGRYRTGCAQRARQDRAKQRKATSQLPAALGGDYRAVAASPTRFVVQVRFSWQAPNKHEVRFGSFSWWKTRVCRALASCSTASRAIRTTLARSRGTRGAALRRKPASQPLRPTVRAEVVPQAHRSFTAPRTNTLLSAYVNRKAARMK